MNAEEITEQHVYQNYLFDVVKENHGPECDCVNGPYKPHAVPEGWKAFQEVMADGSHTIGRVRMVTLRNC